jgi:predicted metal-dependent phosphoesterase TrpH
MESFRADLHCHSTCSDGTLTPPQLVQLARDSGLSGLAITDHDSVAAYSEAIPAAQQAGIDLITGVEFSASHRGISVHVLGYSFAANNPLIISLCDRHEQRRQRRNAAILERLKQLGMPLTQQQVIDGAAIPSDSWGRPHIAQAMVNSGYVRDLQEAFHKYIGEGKPAFVSGDSLSIEETLEIIHRANGFAIIAHPMLIRRNAILRDLIKMPFDGVEVYYANLPNDKYRRWELLAAERGWLATGGSDFHGTTRPAIKLGSSWTREETFRILQQRYKENS